MTAVQTVLPSLFSKTKDFTEESPDPLIFLKTLHYQELFNTAVVVGSFRMVLGTYPEARITIFNKNAFEYHIHTFKDYHKNTFFALSQSEATKMLPIFFLFTLIPYTQYNPVQYNPVSYFALFQ